MSNVVPFRGEPKKELTTSEKMHIALEREEAFVSETTSEFYIIALHVLRLKCNSGGHVEGGDLKPLLVRLYTAICSLSDYQRGARKRPLHEESESDHSEEDDSEEDNDSDHEDKDGDTMDEDSGFDSEEDDENSDDGDDRFGSWFENKPGSIKAN